MTYNNRLHKEDWEVRDIPIAIGRSLVEANHYAKGASNTRTYLHGLFQKGSDICVGCAWWIPPTKSAALATYPENWKGVLSLSRLVIAQGVPKNACTFLLSRSMKLIPRGVWPCLVTYADSWRGHTGGIYKACNWEYRGTTTPESTWTINGVMTARKAGPHTRTKDEMLALGAVMVGRFSKHKFVVVR